MRYSMKQFYQTELPYQVMFFRAHEWSDMYSDVNLSALLTFKQVNCNEL